MKKIKAIFFIILVITLVFITFFYYKNTNEKNIKLQVTNKNIQVDGKNVTVNTIEQADGTWGYYGTVGGDFNVTVENKLKDPTVIHWHGLILPNKDDGTELTQKNINPGKSYNYHFKLKHSGTFWMHSHYGFQEQNLLEAPFIVYPRNYDNKNDIVIMFQDFSYKAPEKIMNDLKHSDGTKNHYMHHMHNMAMTMGEEMKPDLNDVEYDAFLTNYKNTDDPEIKKVVPGQKYRLRFINGSSATNFWINLGKLKGKVLAVDGQDVKPFEGSLFQLAIAQRMDIEITIPSSGIFPIIGQVEGEKEQTGIILTTDVKNDDKNLTIEKQATSNSKAFNYEQLRKLHAKNNDINSSKIEKTINLKLTGNMQDYIWQINGQTWPNISPIQLKYGKTYLFKIENDTGMSHPIHIHGHVFKLIDINDKPIKDGVIRDTIYVAPKSSVTIALKADQLGKWFIHCHMLYHMHSGMMTFIETKQ
ncbi:MULTISPECIES: multicopper oxidase family protein [Francisella]|uniref:Multicopper oxidase family protein n=1 Tax=Francisella opportunistica TaxID=2016517 RepID=A0A345JRN2_9GAMM|nr:MULTISPECIES: multicopper oxidase family protein [Francisella]APC91713.1 Multicopper oxidase [Francisella sp. MA067296]AXH29978.1 multicopper oxidase family protein [Francisella opportunistica]AXH31624.1 copper oxidase [Francisella opportunistica]AXH33269.1 copper oxidase [Francisella opportunistica]